VAENDYSLGLIQYVSTQAIFQRGALELNIWEIDMGTLEWYLYGSSRDLKIVIRS